MRVLVLFVLALIAVAVSAFDYKSALQELVDQQMIEDNAKSSVSFFESRKAEIMSTQTDLTVSGVYGLDFFAASSTATLTCFKNKGHTFLIPRGYRSIGALDPNVVSNIKNAWAVGFKYVDAYIFPCYKCGNGAGQVQTLVSKLRNEGAKFGMIWLDIEGAEYWSRDPSDNAAVSHAALVENSHLLIHVWKLVSYPLFIFCSPVSSSNPCSRVLPPPASL